MDWKQKRCVHSLPHESSSSSWSCTWTRNMQHVCNPLSPPLPVCLSSSPNNGFFSIQAALVFLDACWRWSVYNRWQTLQSCIDYIDYDDADEAGRAAMVPVLSIQPSMFSPAVTSAADRPIAASAERRAANWPIRARGRKSLLCAGCEMMLSRLLMNRCGCRSELWGACLFIYWQLCFEKYEIKTQFVG